ncbi:unnamed protein product [Rotaria sp. Silwood2]|nr:unnamed protein product [Rotaria sp. Silwood2]CAF3908352.1 unnamed protein product [Rotaria sp. Silwood2]CAF4002003.1 unnamed protein product [Rotaria sp. Silwood2]CAF4070668.1 unnamed protein product [Rotaria sp. Silwood2]
MSWDIELDDQLLQDLYAWLDQIPLSRPKKRIEKDFADGVMVAELIKYYFPSWVDLHNYAAANSTQQKLINWGLLNRKILCRFGLNVPEPVMRGICLGRSGLVEVFLYNLRTKVDEVLHQQAKTSESNAITPRHRQQHSPPPLPPPHQQHQQYEENPVKYASMGSKPKPQGGNIPKKATSMQNLSADMVSRIEYDEKEQECIAKEEQIQILQAKIRRLEHLLHLKDIRVDDLAEKLDQTRGVPGNSGGRSNRQQQPHIPTNGRK